MRKNIFQSLKSCCNRFTFRITCRSKAFRNHEEYSFDQLVHLGKFTLKYIILKNAAQTLTLNLCACSCSGPMTSSLRTLISAQGPKKVSISAKLTLEGVEACQFSRANELECSCCFFEQIIAITCVVVQDIWLCHTPRLAEGTCIKCRLFYFAQNSPERVSHESPEESGIARSSFKAESNKGAAIPNGIDLADHLGSDVKKIARKDGDPTVRGTVPPTLKTKLKGNKKNTTLTPGISLLTTGNPFSLKNSWTTLSTPSIPASNVGMLQCPRFL